MKICAAPKGRETVFYHSGVLIGMTSRRRSECRRGQSAHSHGGPGRLVSKFGTFPPATPSGGAVWRGLSHLIGWQARVSNQLREWGPLLTNTD